MPLPGTFNFCPAFIAYWDQAYALMVNAPPEIGATAETNSGNKQRDEEDGT